jgi:hypothetical protein
MPLEQAKSVLDVINRPGSVAGASVITGVSGITTFLELVNPILGFTASLGGIIMLVLLGRNYLKKWELMDAELKMTVKKLNEKKPTDY